MEPTVVYDSNTRPPTGVEEFLQLIRYRELLRQLVRRDILTRYRRSLLGVLWTMLNPLGMMVVLALAFSQVFGSSTPGYAAYVLSGLIAWNFFSQTTYGAMVNLVWGGSLLHRIYLPRTAFALSSIGTGLVNLVLSIVPLIIVMLVSGVPIRVEILWLPLAMLLLAMFTLGVGLFLSALAVYFPDVAEMFQIAIMAWMYLTPIIYPESIVPESYRWWLFNLNPMYHLIKLFRLPLYYGLTPSLTRWGTAALVSVGMLLIGWLFFTRRSDEFSYRV